MSPMLLADDERAMSFAHMSFYRGFAYGWVGATICGLLIWWLT